MSSPLLEPRKQTFDLLGRSRNAAAVPVLAAGLESPSVVIHSRCAELLLKRTEPQARRVLILQWQRLGADIRQSLSSAKYELEPTCREILLTGSPEQRQAAIALARELEMTVALPDLVDLVLDNQNPNREQALECIAEMCQLWGVRVRSGRDTPSVRGNMLETLHRVISDSRRKPMRELIDAWLTLVCWEDSMYRSLINDPEHHAYTALLERLEHCQHPSVLQLLAGHLWRGTTPKSILNIICRRTEEQLAAAIAQVVSTSLLPTALQRVRELPPLTCLQSLVHEPLDANSKTQKTRWLLLAASSRQLDNVLLGAVRFAKSASLEGRRTAADILRSCCQPTVDAIVQAMQSETPLAGQSHSTSSLIKEVFSWMTGPSTVLISASREFFAACTLEKLLAVMDEWPEASTRALAGIVRCIEPEVVPQLLAELENPAACRRLLALQVIQMMNLAGEVTEKVLPLIYDPRTEVRVRTIEVLGALKSRELYALLPELLADPTTDVVEAAGRAQSQYRATTSDSGNKRLLNLAPSSPIPNAPTGQTR